MKQTKDMRIKKILNNIDDCNSILDVGVVQHNIKNEETNSWLHKYLYDKAENVMGIDILEKEIKQLQNKGYNVKVGNAENINTNKKFDYIIAGEIIEHLNNPGAFIKSAYNHLNDDGDLIITTPNPWAIYRFIEATFKDNVNCNPDHTTWFDIKTLTQLLNRYQFEVVKYEFIPPNNNYIHWKITKLIYKIGLSNIGSETILIKAQKR